MRINHHNVSRLPCETIHIEIAMGRGRANTENDMTKLVDRFLQDNSGATSIEYALIASVLSIVILTAVTGLGAKLKGTYTTVTTALN
jgi:pilus assembly protein Flp/PilA